jgi:alkylation response protein AidB-like acyl-CoA dehydrogenase
MDFGYSPEQEDLRQEVRAFIKPNMTRELLEEMEDLNEGFGVSRVRGRGPRVDELFKKIAERGWLGYSFPKEYGGQGKDRISQYIVEEEFARLGIAVGLAGRGAPAILAAGTEEQKREFLPKLISGEYSFALGFTEPQAGADLASLQCRAVRDGDYYVINGQKMHTRRPCRPTST